MPVPSDAAGANSFGNLGDIIGQIAKRGAVPAAELGTVSVSSPLTVVLDTGQEVPQCKGPDGLQPGTRVLAHYISGGHDLAVQPLGGFYSFGRVVFDGATTMAWTTSLNAPPPTLGTAGGSPTGIRIPVSGIYIVSGQKVDGSGAVYWQASDGQDATGTDELVLHQGAVVWTTTPSSRITIDFRAPFTNET